MERETKLYLVREKRCKAIPLPRPLPIVSKENRRMRREIVRAKKLAAAKYRQSGTKPTCGEGEKKPEKDFTRARASTAQWRAKKNARTKDLEEELAHLQRENAAIAEAIKALEELVGDISGMLDIELYTNKLIEDARRAAGYIPDVGLDISALLDD